MNNIHYIIIGLALILAVIQLIKPNTYCLPVAVLLLAIEAFSHVSK